MKAILGKKIGMTQMFLADGTVVPVTVVEAGPCVVTQKKTVETDGYNAIQVGFGDIREKPRHQAGCGPYQEGGRSAESAACTSFTWMIRLPSSWARN